MAEKKIIKKAPTINDRSSDQSVGNSVGNVKKTTKSVKAAKAEVVAEVVSSVEKKTKVEKTVPVGKKVKKTSKNANKDTGSVDYQIKNFSDKIASLAKHLKEHIHDFDSRRGLLIMVGKRRRLLNYVRKSDEAKYLELVKTLKLKK